MYTYIHSLFTSYIRVQMFHLSSKYTLFTCVTYTHNMHSYNVNQTFTIYTDMLLQGLCNALILWNTFIIVHKHTLFTQTYTNLHQYTLSYTKLHKHTLIYTNIHYHTQTYTILHQSTLLFQHHSFSKTHNIVSHTHTHNHTRNHTYTQAITHTYVIQVQTHNCWVKII